MTLKVYLLAFLAAFLIILATAELPTEGKDVLDSDVELDFVNYALQLDQNMAEVKGIRQKREGIADPKKGKGKKRKNSPRKKGNKGRKQKGNNNEKQKQNKKESNNSKIDQKKGKKRGNNNQKKKGSGKNKKPNKSANNKGNTGRRGGRKKSRNGNNGRKGKIPKKGVDVKNRKKGTKTKNRKNGRSGKKSENPQKGGNGKIGRTGEKSKNPKKGEKVKTRKKDKKTKNPNKGRNGKTGRTVKKSKNRNKGKKESTQNMKSKLIKRNKKPNKGTRPGLRQSNATVSLTCLRDAVTYTKFLKDNVVNFLRQYSRLTRQIKLTNNKAGKKGEFKIPAARIIQAGGGDRTNLSCGGSATSVGAKKMLEIANFLDGCAAGIKTDCVPPTINKTELELCKTNAVAYNTTVSTCITMATKGKDACSCFQATAVADEKKVLTKCKASSSAKSSAKARSKCLNTLKYCKANVTAAGVLQYACRYSEEELTATLTQLTANSAAFSKFLAKIKSLTGLSGVLPGTTSNRTSRAVRNTEEENAEEDVFDSPQARMRGKREEVACSTVVTSITTCTTAITNTPALTTVVTKCKAPTYTIATCTDADKTAIQAALNTALEKNAIILAFLDAIKAELTATTGSTPSPSDGTAGTARVAARSRSLLRKMIMEKMQLRN